MTTCPICFPSPGKPVDNRRGGQRHSELGRLLLSLSTPRSTTGTNARSESHPAASRQPQCERSAEHLDRAWPGSSRRASKQVAGEPDLLVDLGRTKAMQFTNRQQSRRLRSPRMDVRDRNRIRCQPVAGQDNATSEIRPAGVRRSLPWSRRRVVLLVKLTSVSNNSRRMRRTDRRPDQRWPRLDGRGAPLRWGPGGSPDMPCIGRRGPNTVPRPTW